MMLKENENKLIGFSQSTSIFSILLIIHLLPW